MNAESTRVMKTDVWTEWEHRVVNGALPLRRFLGGSSQSAVFLTEYKAQKPCEAAIKLVPAPTDTLQVEAQLVQWGAAATLSHPNLIRLFDVGRCQLGGRPFLFVVMEYAEQTLAQILPRRALGPGEVRELLPPTLDALAFLHRNYLVHGQLKPSNFLVVNDQLKLASDTLRAIGTAATGLTRASLYDPPELKDGIISPAGDVWGLGITLVEALTQRTPAWPDERSEKVLLPATLPTPFLDTVRRCLSRAPANRPTVIELETQFNPASQAPATSEPPPPVLEPPRAVTPVQTPIETRSLLPTLAIAAVIALATCIGLLLFQAHPGADQAASDASQAGLQPADESGASAPVASSSLDSAPASSTVAASAREVSARQASSRAARAGSPTDSVPDSPTAMGFPGAAFAPGGSARDSQTPEALAHAGSTAAASELDATARGGSARTTSASASSGLGASMPVASSHASAALVASTLDAPTSAGSARTALRPTASARSSSTPASTPEASARAGSAAPTSTTAGSALPTSGRLAAATATHVAGAAAPASVVAASTGTAVAPTSPSVLHEVVPDVSPDIQGKIRGHIKVSVRVLVDPSGDVVGQFLENPGPSRYFSRLAGDAAGEWKFAPAESRDSRVWQLRFEFTRDGATVEVAAAH